MPCLIALPNGIIVRYEAFNDADELGLQPVFQGAEVITLRDELIHTVSDHYCDPSATNLIEVAKHSENQHVRARATKGGLGARAVARIQRALTGLLSEPSLVLDPDVTVTRLASHVGRQHAAAGIQRQPV